MKKTTILALITVYILSFASCGKQETTSGNESITATVESAQAETTVPEETETEESKTESLPWIPLSSLETHPELRAAFEEYVEVTGTTGNKEGNLYTNPLTTQPDQNADNVIKNTDIKISDTTSVQPFITAEPDNNSAK